MAHTNMLHVNDPLTEIIRSGYFDRDAGTGPEAESSTGESTPRLYSRMITVPPGNGHTWPTHAHRNHELLWGIKGLVTVRTPEAVFALPSGISMWLPAFVPHEVHAGPGTTLRYSYLADPGRAQGLHVASAFVTQPLLHDVLEYLIDPGLEPARRARAEGFALDLIDPGQHVPVDLPLPRTPWLRAVADELLDSPADTRSVADWASGANVSVRTLMRRFAAETGMSLSTWRLAARIAIARQRLTLDESVATVARATGFSSTAAFAAAFRRRTGMSPRQFATGCVIPHQ